jgi:hypothetical protein
VNPAPQPQRAFDEGREPAPRSAEAPAVREPAPSFEPARAPEPRAFDFDRPAAPPPAPVPVVREPAPLASAAEPREWTPTPPTDAQTPRNEP